MISVIIPIFNSEKYLCECIESILTQTFKDYEIVLIDDGSTDNSSIICDRYADEYRNIRAYHIKNGGVSNARNYGISVSHGEYITFVDSDDKISHDYLQRLIELCYSDDVDLVMCGTHTMNENGSIANCYSLKDGVYWVKQVSLDAFEVATMPFITSVWAKLYRRDNILSNKIEFDTTISYAEDRDFNISYLRHTQRVISSSFVGYYYRQGIDGSLSAKLEIEKHLFTDLEYWCKLKEFFKNRKILDDSYLANMLFNILNDGIVQLCNEKKISTTTIFQKVRGLIHTEQIMWLNQHKESLTASCSSATIIRFGALWILPFYYAIYKTKQWV